MCPPPRCSLASQQGAATGVVNCPPCVARLLPSAARAPQLTGPIPDTWGVEPSFNALFDMQIANNLLSVSGGCWGLSYKGAMDGWHKPAPGCALTGS